MAVPGFGVQESDAAFTLTQARCGYTTSVLASRTTGAGIRIRGLGRNLAQLFFCYLSRGQEVGIDVDSEEALIRRM
jgi:hypothetical protein